jgi:hypothetical protein
VWLANTSIRYDPLWVDLGVGARSITRHRAAFQRWESLSITVGFNLYLTCCSLDSLVSTNETIKCLKGEVLHQRITIGTVAIYVSLLEPRIISILAFELLYVTTGAKMEGEKESVSVWE